MPSVCYKKGGTRTLGTASSAGGHCITKGHQPRTPHQITTTEKGFYRQIKKMVILEQQLRPRRAPVPPPDSEGRQGVSSPSCLGLQGKQVLGQGLGEEPAGSGVAAEGPAGALGAGGGRRLAQGHRITASPVDGPSVRRCWDPGAFGALT